MQLIAAFLLIIISPSIAFRPEECEAVAEVEAIKCASGLLAEVDAWRVAVHPPLNNISRTCALYASYLDCVANVPVDCRRSVAGVVERSYDAICEESFRRNISEHVECFDKIESNSSLAECFANHSTAARNDPLFSHTNASSTGPILPCVYAQAYVECISTSDAFFDEHCAAAFELEFDLLDELFSVNDSECILDRSALRSQQNFTEEAICNSKMKCLCNDGFTLSENTTICYDIDECSLGVHDCSQRCINTRGSFKCTCENRYFELSSDGKTCQRKDSDPLWLLFAHGQSIWNISADGRDFHLLKAGLQKVAMIDVDVEEKQIYYADVGSNVIARVGLDGVSQHVIQEYDVDGVEGIAVDWISRNLFSVRRADVFVQTLDGRFRKTLYRNVFRLPRALVAHPRVGKLFASDWSSSAFIARLDMDGSAFEKIVADGVVWPNALTVDVYADRIFWADAFLDIIQSARLDGSKRRTVIANAGSVPHVFGLAVVESFLYWTDWTYRGILRADIHTPENATVLAQTALLPYSVKAFHRSLQPKGENVCDEMGCSQLCLLSSNAKAVCECADGFRLADSRNCVSNCTDSQILCGGSEPRCLSKMLVCDGIAQCPDHADEQFCPRRICESGQYQCHDNKKCLPSNNVCDGVAQCDDLSDEKYCPSPK